MRLADYIVSYSLEINNRCLRYLAENYARGADLPPASAEIMASKEQGLEAQPIYVESMLVRDTRRLLAMWQWIDAADPVLQSHGLALQGLLADMVQPVTAKRLTLKLAAQAAQEEDANLLLRFARGLSGNPLTTWAQLNDLYTSDSDLWRDFIPVSQEVDEHLVCQLLCGYRKGYKAKRKLPSDWLAEQELAVLGQSKQLVKMTLNAEATTHRLELLRPGLSDKGKQQLWYLSKLSDAARLQAGLQHLAELLPASGMKKKHQKQVKRYLQGQMQKCFKRMDRLLVQAFKVRPKRFNGMVEDTLATLGLPQVIRLPTDAENDTGDAREATVLEYSPDGENKEENYA